MSPAQKTISALPDGALFIVRWHHMITDELCRAIWQRTGDHILCLVDNDNANDGYVKRSMSNKWATGAWIEPLTDDESARILALIALGHGELV